MKKSKSPKSYYGYAYSVGAVDKRFPKWKKQRKKRGFDDTETWSLDVTICKYLVPRLKRFRKIAVRKISKKQKTALDRMIKGFDIAKKDGIVGDKKVAAVRRAFKLLGKNHEWLWW